jgi:hypothetical protein
MASGLPTGNDNQKQNGYAPLRDSRAKCELVAPWWDKWRMRHGLA